jgi:Flp pilus assembly protein TadG
MIESIKTRLTDASGVALAELALVLPLLLVLLLGMLDFGKAFNEWIDETHLANDGARLAAVGYPAVVGSCDGSTAANPNTCLTQYIRNGADITELKTGHGGGPYSSAQNAAQVCIYYPLNPSTNSFGQVGDPVQVSVRVDYHWLNYLVSKISLGTTPITGQATMRLERQAKPGALSVPGRKTCYQ